MAARILGSILLLLLISLRIVDPNFIKNIRHQSFDIYQQIKPREYTPQQVTIVDLDEQSLREYGQWPWPRTRIAQLIDQLTSYGAATIGLDIIFSEPDRLSPELIARDNSFLPRELARELSKLPSNESAMAAAMKRSTVVVGQTSVRSFRDRQETGADILDTPHVKIGDDPLPFLIGFPDLVQNVPELENAAAGRGVFSVDPDPDGVNRRLPLVMLVREKIRTSLSIETLRVATGGDSIIIRTLPGGIEGIVVAGQLVTTDANAKVWPYYTKPQEGRYVSAASVLNGSVNPEKINEHIILVGTSAVGLEDYRGIPIGIQVPGVEIHAQVIENILTSTLLNRSEFAEFFEISISAVVGLLIIIFMPTIGAAIATVSAIGIFATTLAFSWWLFDQQRYLVDATWPIFTFASLFVFGATANYLREERKRREIRSAFGQYLSPALVDQLSDNPERLVLGGQTRELTVLFTDVRGFTTISESYKDFPEGLTRLMNRFLTVLSQPILEHRGTIDKYMGDAVMAFWNAPTDEEDHAMQACLAAIEMIENVAKLNDERSANLKSNELETYHEIKVGVGINTGDCVVGNMGSHNRFDYTALGDTVNLASRLEGQSKPYGLPIVIGDNTAEIVKDVLAVYEIDVIRVKGKNEPVKIYALAGDETLAQSSDFRAFRAMNQTMISAYRTRDWISAHNALDILEGLGEKLGLTLEEYLFIYETRISEFSANPPGPNWDGVYTATSK
ncbi:MAG: CHASE2 domain-containing protein [Rhizobiaceae bacterium]